jgi:SAM-dependent methyltransferase
MNIFYSELAAWWPLVSPLEDYVEEGSEIARVLQQYAADSKSLLELGSGGGHVAHQLGGRWALTLTDLSPAMLEVSRRIHPTAEHRVGDLRTLDLGRRFDVVLAHDAIDYMLTEPDLVRALATAHRHLAPGGIALFIPDHTIERFEADTDWGGGDDDHGRSLRFLEWTEPLVPGATRGVTHYSFLVRDADGSVRSLYERHDFGVFPRATWERLLDAAGFDLRVVEERTSEERTPRLLFVGIKRG